MRIGDRLFPYPVLNKNALRSGYNKSSFSLEFNEQIDRDDNAYKLCGIHYVLSNDYLKKLIEEGKARAVCIVESPESLSRYCYDIHERPTDISISLFNVKGRITVSAFIVAAKDIPDFYSDDFADEYGDLAFDIEKNDILAADDGFISTVDFDDDAKKSSIFLVIKDYTIKDKMQFSMGSDYIQIALPETHWNYYNSAKNVKFLQGIWFSLLSVPALTYALRELKDDHKDSSVEVLRIEYKWFDSVVRKHKEVTKKPMTDEVWENLSAETEAQMLFGGASVQAIEDVFKIATNMGGDEDV